jgi:hypothetical protein
MENINQTPKKRINFKKIILVFGIIIVLNLFFNYGVATFYDEPKYDDFCKPELSSKVYNLEEECRNSGGMWLANQSFYAEDSSRSMPVPQPVVKDIKEPRGWCDVQYSCRKNFENALEFYNRNVFIVLIIAGVISIVAGFMIGQSEAVSLGLSFGGLLSLIIGTIKYWSDMDDYLRFIILGVALIILVYMGIKKFRND